MPLGTLMTSVFLNLNKKLHVLGTIPQEQSNNLALLSLSMVTRDEQYFIHTNITGNDDY